MRALTVRAFDLGSVQGKCDRAGRIALADVAIQMERIEADEHETGSA